MAKEKKYRLITRSDFDGLVCAVLFKEAGLLNDIMFAHPKDMQDGKVEVTGNDIITNLPFHEKASMVFDHHLSEIIRNKDKKENHIIDPNAKSAARIVYNYLGGKERFPENWGGFLEAVDLADSAGFTINDILHPKDWVLLNFITDSRTGLGRFKGFRISNLQLMMDLIDYCRELPIEEILDIPDVRERIDFYFEKEEEFKDQIDKCSVVHKNLVILDLRKEKILYPGNRFMIYALFPQCNISIYALNGLNSQNTVFAVGKSTINRSSNTNIGDLMFKYDGGGHMNAGTCQVENDKSEIILSELIQKINQDG